MLRTKTRMIALAGLFTFGGVAYATTYTVKTTGDADLTCTAPVSGASDCQTLRGAMIAANANVGIDGHCAGVSNISFSIPLTQATYAGSIDYYKISPVTPLPPIVCPVNIDGSTQPRLDSTAGPRIELNGNSLATIIPSAANGYPSGLVLLGRDKNGDPTTKRPNGSTIRGLMINGFGITSLYLNGVDDVTVVGNYFGLDVTGQSGSMMRQGARFTISISMEGSTHNFIGTNKVDYEAGTINRANRNVFGVTGPFTISTAHIYVAHFNVLDVAYWNGIAACGTGVLCSQRIELGSSDNVVQGNYIGLNKDGTKSIGGLCNTYPACVGGAVYSSRFGVYIEEFRPALHTTSSSAGRRNVVGGLTPGQGNVIVGLSQAGIIVNSPENKILGNMMGLNAAGTSETDIQPFGRSPLFLAAAAYGNLIQGNTLTNSSNVTGDGGGIRVTTPNLTFSNADAPTVIRDNYIGTDAAATLKDVGNKGGGIKVLSSIPVRLENNLIAYNGNHTSGANNGGTRGFAGVQLSPFVSPLNMRTAILGNRIFCNGVQDVGDPTKCGRGLGIDLQATNTLVGDGPTLNDPGDGDAGHNGLQNFPVLDAERSIVNPALVIVHGMLNSEAGKNYRLQFFSNKNSDARCLQLTAAAPAGYFPEWGCTVLSGFNTAFLASQGEVLIGETTLTTDGSGNASFKVVSKIGIPTGSILTATATRLDDVTGAPLRTSEFSQAIAVDPKGSSNAYIHANGAAGGDGGPTPPEGPESD